MRFDTPPRGKKWARAVVWEATITVMNSEGAMQEFNCQDTSYEAILDKLAFYKQLVDNNYQFRVEEEIPF